MLRPWCEADGDSFMTKLLTAEIPGSSMKCPSLMDSILIAAGAECDTLEGECMMKVGPDR
jgi:hypothetical protein